MKDSYAEQRERHRASEYSKGGGGGSGAPSSPTAKSPKDYQDSNVARHAPPCVLSGVCGTNVGVAPLVAGGALVVLLATLRALVAMGMATVAILALIAIIERALREIDPIARDDHRISAPPAPNADTQTGGAGGGQPPVLPPIAGGTYPDEEPDRGDLRKLGDHEFERIKGYSAEEFKSYHVGRAGGKFNIARGSDGYLYLVSIDKRTVVPTYETWP